MEEHAPHSTTDSQDLLDPQDLEEEEDPEIEPHSIKDKQPWSWKGVLLGLLCVIFLHLAKICGKLVLIHSSLLGSEVSYYRALIVAALVAPWPLCLRSLTFCEVRRKIMQPLYIQALLSGAMSISLYFSMERIPYSEAIMISYTKPIFGVLAARFYLKERVTFLDYLALAVSLAAIFFYMDPGKLLNAHSPDDFKNGEDPDDLLGILLALLAGFLGGLDIIFIRKLDALGVHVLVETFYGGIFGMLLAPLLIIPAQDHAPRDPDISVGVVFLLIAAGVAYILGQVFEDKAFHMESASRVVMIMYLEVLIAIILDVLILGSTLQWPDYVAGGLIFLSLLTVALRR